MRRNLTRLLWIILTTAITTLIIMGFIIFNPNIYRYGDQLSSTRHERFEAIELSAYEQSINQMKLRAEEIRQRCNGSEYHERSPIKCYLRREGVPFVYTPTPKCGWSTWVHALFDAANQHQLLLDSFKKGITDYRLPIHKIGLKLVHDVDEINEIDVERFMVIRNPFSRLISGYKFRILKQNNPICRGVPKVNVIKPLPFPTFVTCLIHQANRTNKPIRLTAAQKLIDIHFQSQVHVTSACLINYTFVAEMQSFTEDTKALLTKFNLNSTVSEANKSANTGLKDGDYLKQLSPDQLRDLREYLRADFHILGYDPHDIDL